MAYRYDVNVLDLDDHEYKFYRGFGTIDEAFQCARKLFKNYKSVQIDKYIN